MLLGADFFGVQAASEVMNAVGLVCLAVATLLTIWSGVNYIVKNRAVFAETKE